MDSEDIRIHIDPQDADAGTTRINQNLASIESAAAKAGEAIGTQISKGAQTSVRVIDQSTTTINRLLRNAEKQLQQLTAAGPQTKLQRGEAAIGYTRGAVAGDSAALEKLAAIEARYIPQLRAQAEAEASVAKALDARTRNMQYASQWQEKLSQLQQEATRRAQAQAQAEQKLAAESRARVEAARKQISQWQAEQARALQLTQAAVQRQSMLGRTPEERAALERRTEMRAGMATAVATGDPNAIRAAAAAYRESTARLQEQVQQQQMAAKAAAAHAHNLSELDRVQRTVSSRQRAAVALAEEQRQAQERQNSALASYSQRLELVGRSPIQKQLLSLQQEFDRMTAGLAKSDPRFKQLRQSYDSAIQRTKTLEGVTRSTGEEFRRFIERLGAAFVAYNILNLAIRKGIVDTAIYAARTETLGVALAASARANNLSLAGIRQQEESIKKLGITTQEAREALTRMITVQIDTAKATQLARLAQDAAVISNMNSSEAFSNMIYGIQSGQVRVLRTIGINVQFQESYQRLAAQLGKNVLELTEEQKAMARLNEVLRVAPQYFGLYESAMTSTGKQLTSLKRYADEARNAIGKEFVPALDLAVKSLTALFQKLAEKPEVGSWGTILLGGGSLALGAKFALGSGVAKGVGVATLGAAATKASIDIQRLLTDKIRGFILSVGVEIEQASKKPIKDATISLISSIARLVEDARKWIVDAAKDLWRFGAGPSQREIMTQGLTRPDIGVPPIPPTALSKSQRGPNGEILSMGGGAATPDTQKYLDEKLIPRQQEVFRQRLHALDQELALEDRLARARQRYQEVRESSDTKNLASSYAEFKAAEAAIEQFKRQAEIQSTLDSLHRAATVQETEYLRNTVSWYEKLSDLKLTAAQWADARVDLERMAYAEETKELAKQEIEWRKLIEDARKFHQEVVDKEIEDGLKRIADRAKEVQTAMERVGDLYRDAARSAIERQSQLQERLTTRTAGPNAGVVAIESSRQIQLQLAEELLQYDLQQSSAIVDFGKKAESIARARIEYSRRVEEAEISRIQRIAELEQQHFDSLKRSFEGLFDAAFQSARSFGSALKRMLVAAFLTPVKEQLSTMFATAFLPMAMPKPKLDLGLEQALSPTMSTMVQLDDRDALQRASALEERIETPHVMPLTLDTAQADRSLTSLERRLNSWESLQKLTLSLDASPVLSAVDEVSSRLQGLSAEEEAVLTEIKQRLRHADFLAGLDDKIAEVLKQSQPPPMDLVLTLNTQQASDRLLEVETQLVGVGDRVQKLALLPADLDISLDTAQGLAALSDIEARLQTFILRSWIASANLDTQEATQRFFDFAATLETPRVTPLQLDTSPADAALLDLQSRLLDLPLTINTETAFSTLDYLKTQVGESAAGVSGQRQEQAAVTRSTRSVATVASPSPKMAGPISSADLGYSPTQLRGLKQFFDSVLSNPRSPYRANVEEALARAPELRALLKLNADIKTETATVGKKIEENNAQVRSLADTIRQWISAVPRIPGLSFAGGAAPTDPLAGLDTARADRTILQLQQQATTALSDIPLTLDTDDAIRQALGVRNILSKPVDLVVNIFSRITGIGMEAKSGPLGAPIGGGGGRGLAGLFGGMASDFGRYGSVFSSSTPGGTPGFAGPVGAGPSASAGAGAGAAPTGPASLFSASSWKAQLAGLKGGLSSLGNIGFGQAQSGPLGAPVGAGVKGVGGVAGGAMLLGGGTLAALGLKRGGWSGLGMTTAGGALIGAKFGGPIGAAIGAGVGFGAGLVRMLFKSATEKARQKINTLYKVDIKDRGILQQIVDSAKQSYGGNLDVAIQSQQIRELIELYAMSTGQNFGGIVDRPRALSIAQSSGRVNETPSYMAGRTLPSTLLAGAMTPSMLGVSKQPASSPTPAAASQTIVLRLDGPATTSLLSGVAVQSIQRNPRSVQTSALRAVTGSTGRREMAAALLSPSTVIS